MDQKYAAINTGVVLISEISAVQEQEKLEHDISWGI